MFVVGGFSIWICVFKYLCIYYYVYFCHNESLQLWDLIYMWVTETDFLVPDSSFSLKYLTQYRESWSKILNLILNPAMFCFAQILSWLVIWLKICSFKNNQQWAIVKITFNNNIVNWQVFFKVIHDLRLNVPNYYHDFEGLSMT